MDNNKISDIKVLKNIKLEKLNTLHLSVNEISDISVLEYIKLQKLEYLYLMNNKIDKDKNRILISNIRAKISNIYI